jgi:hypothetical protein
MVKLAKMAGKALGSMNESKEVQILKVKSIDVTIEKCAPELKGV